MPTTCIDVLRQSSPFDTRGVDFGIESLTVYDNHLYSGSFREIRKWDLSGRGIQVLKGHTSYVYALTVFQDHLYSGSSDNKIRKWDAQGQCRQVLDCGSAVRTLTVYDNHLYSGSSDKTIRKWDAQGTCVQVLDCGSSVYTLTVYDDHLYSGSSDDKIRKWDARGHCRQVLEGHTGSVRTLTVYDNHLYSGSDDKTIRKWDASGTCVQVLDCGSSVYTLSGQGNPGHTSAVLSLTVFDNHLYSGSKVTDFDNHLYSGSKDSSRLYPGKEWVDETHKTSFCKWDLANGTCVQELQPRGYFPEFDVNALTVFDNFLYSGSNHGKIYKWVDEETLERKRLIEMAFLEGEEKLPKCRVFLFGEGRCGKTSLRKTLFGEAFDAHEKSTEVVSITSNRGQEEEEEDSLLLDITKNNLDKNMKKQVDIPTIQNSNSDDDSQDDEGQLVLESAKEMNRLQQNEFQLIFSPQTIPPKEDDVPSSSSWSSRLSPSSDNSSTIVSSPSQFPSSVKTSYSMNNSINNDNRNSPKTETSLKETNNQVLTSITSKILASRNKKKQPNINNSQIVEEITISYWDFAGQEIYYVLNETFIQRQNIYLVVFNLKHFDLDKNEDTRRQKQEAIENILLWLNNIHSHSRQSASSSRKSESSTPANIFIVGTHVDSLIGDNILNDIETLLRNHLERSPILNQIQKNPSTNRLYFAVSCKERSQSDLHSLLGFIESKSRELVHHELNPSIPIRWLHYLKHMQSSKNIVDYCLSYEEAYEAVQKAQYTLLGQQQQQQQQQQKGNQQHVSLYEFDTILKYFHDMGEIIYFGKSPTTTTTTTLVVVNPVWVASTFQKIIWREDLIASTGYLEFVDAEFQKLDEIYKESFDGNAEAKWKKMWRDFVSYGVLDRQLLQIRWYPDKRDYNENKNIFDVKVNLLLQLGILSAIDTTDTRNTFALSSPSASEIRALKKNQMKTGTSTTKYFCPFVPLYRKEQMIRHLFCDSEVFSCIASVFFKSNIMTKDISGGGFLPSGFFYRFCIYLRSQFNHEERCNIDIGYQCVSVILDRKDLKGKTGLQNVDKDKYRLYLQADSSKNCFHIYIDKSVVKGIRGQSNDANQNEMKVYYYLVIYLWRIITTIWSTWYTNLQEIPHLQIQDTVPDNSSTSTRNFDPEKLLSHLLLRQEQFVSVMCKVLPGTVSFPLFSAFVEHSCSHWHLEDISSLLSWAIEKQYFCILYYMLKTIGIDPELLEDLVAMKTIKQQNSKLTEDEEVDEGERELKILNLIKESKLERLPSPEILSVDGAIDSQQDNLTIRWKEKENSQDNQEKRTPSVDEKKRFRVHVFKKKTKEKDSQLIHPVFLDPENNDKKQSEMEDILIELKEQNKDEDNDADLWIPTKCIITSEFPTGQEVYSTNISKIQLERSVDYCIQISQVNLEKVNEAQNKGDFLWLESILDNFNRHTLHLSDPSDFSQAFSIPVSSSTKTAYTLSTLSSTPEKIEKVLENYLSRQDDAIHRQEKLADKFEDIAAKWKQDYQDKLDKLIVVNNDKEVLASVKQELNKLYNSQPELELQSYYVTFLRFMNSFLTAACVCSDSGLVANARKGIAGNLSSILSCFTDGIPGGEILCELLNCYDQRENDLRIQRIRELTNNDVMDIHYFNNLLCAKRTIQYGSTIHTTTTTVSTTSDTKSSTRKEMEEKAKTDAKNIFEALCTNGIGKGGIIKVSDHEKYTENSKRMEKNVEIILNYFAETGSNLYRYGSKELIGRIIQITDLRCPEELKGLEIKVVGMKDKTIVNISASRSTLHYVEYTEKNSLVTRKYPEPLLLKRVKQMKDNGGLAFEYRDIRDQLTPPPNTSISSTKFFTKSLTLMLSPRSKVPTGG